MRNELIIAALVSSFFFASPAMAKPKKGGSSTTEKALKTAAPEPAPEPEAPAHPTGVFSDEQTMLNNQAVEAVSAGNYKKAEQLFSAMIQIGEFDIVWWNLGNTFAVQNKCIEAREAFSHVDAAPATTDYAHEDVMALVAEDQVALEQRCNAPIKLECKTPQMTITIDGGKEFFCSGKEIRLTPGAHSLYAQTSFGFSQLRVDAVANQTVSVPVEVINYEEIAANGGLTAEEKAHRSMIFKAVGWSLFGVGVGVAAGGGALLGVSYFDYQDQAKAQRDSGDAGELYEKTKSSYDDTTTKMNISYGLIAGGSALVVAGATLLIIDALKYSDNSSDETTATRIIPQPYISKDGAGMGLTFEF